MKAVSGVPSARTFTAFAFIATAALILLGSCSEPPPPGPNIIIVVLDTVRVDRTGAGGARSVTPTLDALGEEGAVFTRACANGPWTVPSHASIFSGLLPSSHRCTSRRFAFLPGSPTFAELLADRGYETVAFFSNPWLSDRLTGMLVGFDERFSEVGQGMEILNSTDQGGARTLANIARWLDARRGDQPFLVFVNFLEAHLPYDPPDKYREAYLTDEPEGFVVTTEWAQRYNARVQTATSEQLARAARFYDGDVNTSDRCLGQLLEQLMEHGLYDDTVIIVTSDHGENLGDHGFLDHQFGVFETLVDVPLVVRAPGLVEPGRRSDPVMLSDIYDTVLEIGGVTDGPETPHSRSLVAGPIEASRPQIAEYAGANHELLEYLGGLNPSLDLTRYRTAYAKARIDDLELTIGSDGSVELYDLARDPGRTSNIAGANPDAVSALRAVIPEVDWGEPEDSEIDAELRDRLRSLGYVQ
jgi:arylsulfatase A-like enzyme